MTRDQSGSTLKVDLLFVNSLCIHTYDIVGGLDKAIQGIHRVKSLTINKTSIDLASYSHKHNGGITALIPLADLSLVRSSALLGLSVRRRTPATEFKIERVAVK